MQSRRSRGFHGFSTRIFHGSSDANWCAWPFCARWLEILSPYRERQPLGFENLTVGGPAPSEPKFEWACDQRFPFVFNLGQHWPKHPPFPFNSEFFFCFSRCITFPTCYFDILLCWPFFPLSPLSPSFRRFSTSLFLSNNGKFASAIVLPFSVSTDILDGIAHICCPFSSCLIAVWHWRKRRRKGWKGRKGWQSRVRNGKEEQPHLKVLQGRSSGKAAFLFKLVLH